jgi:hypothetical protein
VPYEGGLIYVMPFISALILNMTCVIFYFISYYLVLNMKITFAGATTIGILLILASLTYNSIPPARSATPNDADWQLTVTGIVKNPLTLNWTEITALPKTIVPAALICVDFPNKILLQGYWGGVKLDTLIELAESSPSVAKVAFYAADGYSTDLTIETAKRNDTILAYELNSTSLNDLRLVVPGKWGYKWISQITNIELVDYNYLGRWESAGYPDDADISAGGGQSVKDLRLLPKVNNTSPTPTPTPLSPTPSPSPSPVAPSDQTTPTPEPFESMSIPTEAIYAIALFMVVVVLVVALTFVRKKK